jgi:hypothetical protein
MSKSVQGAVSADLLLIGGGFFGYAKEITEALERRGRVVTWFEDRPGLDTFTKTAIRLAPALVAAKAERYVDSIIKAVGEHPIRDVLVIKGEALSPASIRRLRAALPNARFTLYFWDSYRNMSKDSREKVAYFNRAFTFDPNDADADQRLRYRPLFFIDEYARLPPANCDIDLLFFGTVHSDRYTVLTRLARNLPPEVRFERVLYFPSKLVYAARRTFDPSFWRSRRHEFIFKPLNKKEVQALISRARVLVDIERAVQGGLTMRTIEMLGAAKKLVTTNPRIVEAEFFNPRNIAIIDRQRPVVAAEFLDLAYEPPVADLLRRYSLSGWIDEVVPSKD